MKVIPIKTILKSIFLLPFVTILQVGCTSVAEYNQKLDRTLSKEKLSAVFFFSKANLVIVLQLFRVKLTEGLAGI